MTSVETLKAMEKLYEIDSRDRMAKILCILPDGRVVKVLDSQPRDHGFESRHTLGLLCLKSLGKICTPNVP